MCRSGVFDTMMMLTTTISVISIYNTNRVVIFPIICLSKTVDVVVIPFYIIVSFGFISLLVVTVGISRVSVVSHILSDG
jgi:hypothetical protein